MKDAHIAAAESFQLIELQKEIEESTRLSVWMKVVSALALAVNLLCARKGDILVPLVTMPAVLIFLHWTRYF